MELNRNEEGRVKKLAMLFLLIISIGLTGLAEQTWEEVSNCPPDEAFTYCTVLDGYWSMVQFDESLERLALMSRRKLDVADTQSGEILASFVPPAAWMEFIGFPVFTADGSLVACPLTDGTVLMWDIETGELAGTFPSRLRGQVAVFSQDSTLLATQGEPGEIMLWSTETEQPLVSLSELNAYSYVIPLGFSHDDAFFFASGISMGGEPRVTGAWDVETGNLVRVFPGSISELPDGSLYTLVTLPDGESPLYKDEPSLTLSTQVSLWDGIFGDLVQAFNVSDPLLGASISHTGQLLAVGRLNGIIELWDVAAQREVYRIDLNDVVPEATGEFDSVILPFVWFSLDDSLLATAVLTTGPSIGNYVHFWNITDLLGDED